MKKYLIWPVFLLLVAVLFVAYARTSNCRDGLWIGSCAVGVLYVVALIVISLLFYLISTAFLFIRARKKQVKLSQKTIIISGVVSLMFIPFIFLAGVLISFLSFTLIFFLGPLLSGIVR